MVHRLAVDDLKNPKGQNSWVAWCGKMPYVHGIWDSCVEFHHPKSSWEMSKVILDLTWDLIVESPLPMFHFQVGKKRRNLMDHLLFVVTRTCNNSIYLGGSFQQLFPCSSFGNVRYVRPILGKLDPWTKPWASRSHQVLPLGFHTPRVHTKFLAAASRPPMIHMPLLPALVEMLRVEWARGKNRMGDCCGLVDVEDFPGNTKWKLSICQVIQAVTFWSLS